ncbi:uncharacterized protein LOC110680556 [Aedes aegypti]|uniref:Uncharacterized protein n=1 Tax=Aedes aegypti TaxID=7159 RepID=A0A903VLW3_AEDAE|nr:uncharacterized protein LOC110680556 [Aedes aegypti]
MENCDANNLSLDAAFAEPILEPVEAVEVPSNLPVDCSAQVDDGVPCDFVTQCATGSISQPAMTTECCGGNPALPRQRSQGNVPQQNCYNCSCGRPDCTPVKKVVSAQ